MCQYLIDKARLRGLYTTFGIIISISDDSEYMLNLKQLLTLILICWGKRFNMLSGVNIFKLE